MAVVIAELCLHKLKRRVKLGTLKRQPAKMLRNVRLAIYKGLTINI